MELFSLGNLYVSDFLLPDEEPRSDPWELKLVMDDDTGLVHLERQPPPELMWGRYWYRSGTNATMTHELGKIVMSAERWVEVDRGELWVDIASNDGTLLSHVDTADGALGRVRVGVDPASDSFREEAEKHAERIYQVPFNAEVAMQILGDYGAAKVITCIAMFYDLMDPNDFLVGVRGLLADDGIFILQLSYTPLMLHQLAFDNVCHEHACYYTLKTLGDVLGRNGFKIIDVGLNDVNGGSLRVYAVHEDADVTLFGSQPQRDIGYFRVSSLLTYERQTNANTPGPWFDFWAKLRQLRYDVRTFIREAVARGETVWGYGASTKGNTLLQFFDLNHEDIEAISERQPQKFGLRTVGTNIPIEPDERMREANPNYLLMLPWHFINEFKTRERAYLRAGGRFIVPCPRFEVIGD